MDTFNPGCGYRPQRSPEKAGSIYCGNHRHFNAYMVIGELKQDVMNYQRNTWSDSSANGATSAWQHECHMLQDISA